jgi:hypothetical protein
VLGDDGDVDDAGRTSMLVAMLDWPSFLKLIVTCEPVAVDRPATVFDEPLTFVSSSYLNFISDPVDVLTVMVLVFVSTSVISPVATVEACEEPSAGDDGLGDLGDCGDGALVDGGC